MPKIDDEPDFVEQCHECGSTRLDTWTQVNLQTFETHAVFHCEDCEHETWVQICSRCEQLHDSDDGHTWCLECRRARQQRVIH